MAYTFEIITDATVDFIPEMIEEMRITVIPMEFRIGQEEKFHHYDFREMSSEEFYNKLKSGLHSTTSQVTPIRFAQLFRSFAQEGKDFLYLGFSSGMSGTYDASLVAINQLKEEFPSVNMIAVDTLCASGGEGLAVYLAAKMREEGRSIQEVAEYASNQMTKKIIHWVSVDDLKQLVRGGRLGAVSASIGTMLHVKPILHVNQEGRLEVVSKCRGNKAKLKNLVETFQSNWVPSEHREVVIFHAQAEEEALKAKEMIEELDLCRQFPPEILISEIGPVVGSHTGKGCLCAAFWGKGRN